MSERANLKMPALPNPNMSSCCPSQPSHFVTGAPASASRVPLHLPAGVPGRNLDGRYRPSHPLHSAPIQSERGASEGPQITLSLSKPSELKQPRTDGGRGGGSLHTDTHSSARARPTQAHLTHVDSFILICAPREDPPLQPFVSISALRRI